MFGSMIQPITPVATAHVPALFTLVLAPAIEMVAGSHPAHVERLYRGHNMADTAVAR